jgi:hypothetical protein
MQTSLNQPSNSVSSQNQALSVQRQFGQYALQSGLVCTVESGRLVKLRELRAHMQLCLQEARSQQKTELFLTRAMVVAKSVNMVANLILEVTAEIVPGKAPKIISGTSAVIQSAIAGDKTEMAVGLAKVSGAAFGVSGTTEWAIDEVGSRATFVRDALYGDLNKHKVSKLVIDNSLGTSVKIVDEFAKIHAGNPIILDKLQYFGTTLKLAKIIYGQSEKFLDILAEIQSAQSLSKNNSGAVQTALSTLATIDARIRELEAVVANCGIPRLESLA